MERKYFVAIHIISSLACYRRLSALLSRQLEFSAMMSDNCSAVIIAFSQNK